MEAVLAVFVSDFESAQNSLESLIEWAEANALGNTRNEATTRLHLIDQLLVHCLAWPREQITAEERFERTYTDYTLGSPAHRLVVEAKREGIYFELPAGFTEPTAPLTLLCELDTGIDQAIRQAIGYCQERGIPVGAITNGHQIVAFIGSRQDGVPPIEGRGLVFPSLDDMRARFSSFWDNLSRPGIESLRIFATLRTPASLPPPEKLSSRTLGYPGFKTRSEQAQDLSILGEMVIEDLVQSPDLEKDFLEACYSPSGALSQYALISREILQSRYSLLFQEESGIDVKPAVRRKGTAAELLSGDSVAAALSRRPILLLGDVGVGKTIFLRHLIKVDMVDILDRAIVLYIDFVKEPALTTDLEPFIQRQFARQLREDHDIDIEEDGFVRGVYHSELSRFAKGIYGRLQATDPSGYLAEELKFLGDKVANTPGHLKAAITHLSKAQRRQVIAFLDNMDQRPLEFQEQLFQVAQSLAETWPLAVFVSLRPETFYRSRNRGALTAYQPRVFTISPPRIDRVLGKRLEFAQYLLETEGRLPTFPQGFTVDSSMLADYLKMLQASLGSNDELLEFIENLSGGNVRTALSFVSAFVGSAHVNTRRILDELHQGEEYIIQLHDFTRAVMLGEHQFYYPLASPIANLFDISMLDGREHFLAPLLVAYIDRTGAAGGQEGYILASAAYEYLQSLGFQPAQIAFQLDRLKDKGLIEASPEFANGAPERFRVTTVGAYSVKRLIATFTYLDAVIVDIPIVDDAVRHRVTDATSLLERLTRAEEVRQYLDQQWDLVAQRGIPFDWAAASDGIRRSIVRIRRRVEEQIAEARGEDS